ncbi:MAG: hypothetical protein AAF366_14050 [Pseudomonadota bacterium]
MAVFINSWTLGIALALLTLPGVAALSWLSAAWLFVIALIVAGLVMFALVYCVPEGAAEGPAAVAATAFPVLALGLAGAIWAFTMRPWRWSSGSARHC